MMTREEVMRETQRRGQMGQMVLGQGWMMVYVALSPVAANGCIGRPSEVLYCLAVV